MHAGSTVDDAISAGTMWETGGFQVMQKIYQSSWGMFSAGCVPLISNPF